MHYLYCVFHSQEKKIGKRELGFILMARFGFGLNKNPTNTSKAMTPGAHEAHAPATDMMVPRGRHPNHGLIIRKAHSNTSKTNACKEEP